VRVHPLLIALLVTPALWAQPLSLTLAQAQALAVQSNPQLGIAQFSAEAAHQVPREIHAGTLPSLTANVTAVGTDSGNRLAAGALNNPVIYNRLASGLSVSQLITDFGRTSNLTASAEIRAQAQDQFTQATRADVLIAVTRAYFGVLRAQAILKVAEQTVSTRQLLSDQATTLFRNQLKSQLDVSFADVNLSDAKLLVSQAQNDLQADKATLATALGLPSQSDFTLAEEADPGPLPASPDRMVDQALRDRPDLKAAELEQSAAERQVKAEHAAYYPTIAAAGVAGFAPLREADKIQGRFGAVGVNVSIPVFNGGLFAARQNEAGLRARAAAQRTNDLRNRITRDLRLTYLNAKTAYERVGLTAQLLQQAGLSVNLAQGRYDLGLGSIVELSQAQLNLTSAQIANAAARYDYQAQRIAVDYQAGSLR
jgi:outer membrane protein